MQNLKLPQLARFLKRSKPFARFVQVVMGHARLDANGARVTARSLGPLGGDGLYYMWREPSAVVYFSKLL